MKIRCVVTGIDRQGKAIFVSDGEPRDRLEMGGFQMADAWSTAGELTVGPEADSRSPWQMAALPAPGGTVLRYAVIPPLAQQAAALQHRHDGGAGDFEVEHDDPSMHTTDSVDCGFVLSGEIGLELDDGVITWMQPGDCFIQQGTRHAWRNRGEVPAVIGVVMLGARRRDAAHA